ncbi:hypothetical protein PLEI_0959 [Photobacterium leiognathi lrivu.4.1]|uniref:Uncharacterized protein n=1 Tax=Photobacterium leiognathi lrivu.4.1 TaxID=1248232 RepID=X0NMT7_PHOLE|nr:hypothetical protein PLEI_0959 [Photobacterium leiognathi lrivu.4.1]
MVSFVICPACKQKAYRHKVKRNFVERHFTHKKHNKYQCEKCHAVFFI